MAIKHVPFGDLHAFHVVVETTAGSKKKYEYDHEMGVLKLDGVLYEEVAFPFNYGFVSQTESGDGDNLDVFIISTHPLTSGTVVKARAIGMMEVIDRGREDHKIIAIPIDESRLENIQTLEDLPIEYVNDFKEFYKAVAKQWNREIYLKGFHGKERAKKELLRTQVFGD